MLPLIILLIWKITLKETNIKYQTNYLIKQYYYLYMSKNSN